ncbi:hypothetical protein FN846DRAFT_770661, partial [Sphaerosporella brunnea]
MAELDLNQKQRLFLDLVIYGLTRTEQLDQQGSSISKSIETIDELPSTHPLCIYLGGEGGTGKSVAIKAVELLMDKLHKGGALQLCATTGSAADNIGGTTYHSALNVTWGGGQGFKPSSSQLAKWQDKSILIVDEISMLS